jgi:hypothetical protein
MAMLVALLLSLGLSVAQPGPAYLPWPAEAGPPPPVPAASREAPPARRAAATLRFEVNEEEMPSFEIPVPSARGADLPSFAIPVRRAAVPETSRPRK